MLRKTLARLKGFTLIELLTVIAIIGILAAILIPTVGRVRETARRTVDQSNIRQIVQSSLIFANDNDGRLPGGNTGNPGSGLTPVDNIQEVAAALAYGGGLNDANLWVSQSDTNASVSGLSTVVDSTRTAYTSGFTSAPLSVGYVTGLTNARPSTVPVATTRGVAGTGLSAFPTSAAGGAVYRGEGGHVGYIGGNVAFIRSPASTPFTTLTGGTSNDFSATYPNSASLRQHGSGTAANDITGTGGT